MNTKKGSPKKKLPCQNLQRVTENLFTPLPSPHPYYFSPLLLLIVVRSSRDGRQAQCRGPPLPWASALASILSISLSLLFFIPFFCLHPINVWEPVLKRWKAGFACPERPSYSVCSFLFTLFTTLLQLLTVTYFALIVNYFQHFCHSTLSQCCMTFPYLGIRPKASPCRYSLKMPLMTLDIDIAENVQ